MTIQTQKFINVAMVLLSWLTLIKLGKRNIKRFLPASILILLVEMLHARYGKSQRWWVFNNKPKSFLFGEFPFQVGPFFAISMWFLKWTYGNFKWFISLNGITNAIFAYPIAYFARKYRYFRLVRFNSFQFFLYFFYKAFLMYFFQYFIENKRNSPKG